MSRPIKFEEFRYVGDKRTQRYFDLDDPDLDADAGRRADGVRAVRRFGPDTPAEARNRGYRAFAALEEV